MRKRHMVSGMLAVFAMSGTLLTGCGRGSGGSNAANNTSANNTSVSNNTTPGNSSTNTTGSNNAQTAAKKGSVSIGYVNWTEDVADVYLWKQLLEQRGYTVNLHLLSAGPLWQGLANGGVDFHFDVWLPTTDETYMKRYGSKLVNLGKWYKGQTKLGFVVPKYVKINSISQLNAHASEFKNQIIGIDPGAGETQIINKKVIPDYGLHLKLVNGSESTMLTALKRAYDAKKPVVVVLWSPHWAFAKWNLKYLKDPKGSFGKAGWIQTEANKQWAGSHPTIVGWLKNFKLNQQQLGTLENDINTAGSKSAGVKKWISDNQSLVNTWFSKS